MAPPEEIPQKGTLVGFAGKLSITIYLLLFSFLLVYGLVQFWPSPSPASSESSAPPPVMLFCWKIFVSDEVRLLLIVAMAGALGGLVHSLRSLYWYVGNKELMWNWMLMYVLRPFVGTTLALVFYFVIRGGLFSPQATVSQTSPFGFAGLGGLIGLFSDQAVLKLKEVAETLLSKPAPGADAIPQESKATIETTGVEKEKQKIKAIREN
jgi:hypothetical protein